MGCCNFAAVPAVQTEGVAAMLVALGGGGGGGEEGLASSVAFCG